jgi:hypothetical protein
MNYKMMAGIMNQAKLNYIPILSPDFDTSSGHSGLLECPCSE